MISHLIHGSIEEGLAETKEERIVWVRRGDGSVENLTAPLLIGVPKHEEGPPSGVDVWDWVALKPLAIGKGVEVMLGTARLIDIGGKITLKGLGKRAGFSLRGELEITE